MPLPFFPKIYMVPGCKTWYRPIPRTAALPRELAQGPPGREPPAVSSTGVNVTLQLVNWIVRQ